MENLLSRLRMKWDPEPVAERGSMSRSSLEGRMGDRTFVDYEVHGWRAAEGGRDAF